MNTFLKPFAFLLSTWLLNCFCLAADASFTRTNLHPHQAPMRTSILDIKVEEIALALRWTGEMNRRLSVASRKQPEIQRRLEEEQIPQTLDPFRGGQASVYRIATAPNTPVSETLSVFHTKHPRSKVANGARRWGPELSKYLHTLVAILSFGEDNVSRREVSSKELTLAMIYMDRACSVETPRSDGHNPCPYCTPRTVHRLTVAALLVALESSRGTLCSESLLLKVSNILDIPELELQEMVDWLRAALGDQGTHVAAEQLEDFTQTWNYRFGGAVPAATIDTTYEPMESNQFVPISCSGTDEIAQRAPSSSSLPSVFA